MVERRPTPYQHLVQLPAPGRPDTSYTSSPTIADHPLIQIALHVFVPKTSNLGMCRGIAPSRTSSILHDNAIFLGNFPSSL